MLRPPGQSLLELLAAIAVISLAVVGLSALGTASLAAAAQSASRLQAAYLALEGVEYLRYARDQNVADGLPWSNGILITDPDHANLVPTYGLVGKEYAFQSVFGVGDHDQPLARLYATAIGVPTGQGIAAQGADYVGGTAAPTQFTRVITVQAVCFAAKGTTEWLENPGTPCSDGSAPVGAEIQSDVEWSARGASYHQAFNTRLYGWQ